MNNNCVRLRSDSVSIDFIVRLALSLIFLVLLGGCSFRISHGADTPDQVVEQYLLALESKDEDLMLQLIPRNYLADQAVEDKISQFGGHDIKEHNVVVNELKPIFLRTTVQATYASSEGGTKEFEDTFIVAYQGTNFWQRTLERKKGRWYLLIGKSKIPNQS